MNKSFHAILCMLVASLLGAPAEAEIYRYTDKYGRLHFSDTPPPAGNGKARALTRQSLSSERFADGIKIYKYIDSRGVVHLTDQAPDSRYQLIYVGYHGRGVDASSLKVHQRAGLYKDLIDEVAQRYHLDSNLLHAVVRVESAYNPNAVSPKGAKGLMQLMPATARRFGVLDRADPRENLNGGARYLKKLLQLFDQDLKLALAGYNAGENAVKRYGNKIPPYKETRNYVNSVLAFYDVYRRNPL